MKKIAMALAVLLALASPAAAANDPVKCDLTLYGWLAGLDGTMGFANAGSQEVTATFQDLAEFVDFAMAGHFEATTGKGILITDVSYTGLGAERQAQVGGQTVDIDLDINQWIVEFGGGYRASKNFDLLLAGRLYVFDTGTTSTSIAGSTTEDSGLNWADIYVGARYHRMLGEKWLVALRGDVGTGGSDFAWFGDLALGYHFSPKVTALASWRMLGLDYQGDEPKFIYDITQAGIGLGIGYSF